MIFTNIKEGLRDTKIMHKVGETVEVSPIEFMNLVSIGSAEPYREAAEEKPKKRTTTKKG